MIILSVFGVAKVEYNISIWKSLFVYIVDEYRGEDS